MQNQRHLPLTGAYNFRDLGGYRTRTGGMTRWRRLLRADSPHRLSRGDIETLLGVGLRTVIDLRSGNEIADAPNPFAANDQVAYRNIQLFDHLAPDTMRDGQTAGSDDPLLAFYVTTLARRQAAIRSVLTAIATAPDGIVLFHCTAGKDRTGLISALLLGLAEVEDEDIVSDYAQTKPLIAGLVAEFLELARNNGTDLAAYRPLLECSPATMRNVIAHVRDCYHSVPGFLSATGLGPDLTLRLKNRLMA